LSGLASRSSSVYTFFFSRTPFHSRRACASRALHPHFLLFSSFLRSSFLALTVLLLHFLFERVNGREQIAKGSFFAIIIIIIIICLPGVTEKALMKREKIPILNCFTTYQSDRIEHCSSKFAIRLAHKHDFMVPQLHYEYSGTNPHFFVWLTQPRTLTTDYYSQSWTRQSARNKRLVVLQIQRSKA
jgi:hypothetical protein